MDWRMKNQVFLSYSHKDIYRARRMRDALIYAGFDVWPDEALTPGTPSWMTEVEARMRAAACVVLILSRDTRLSNWVTKVIHMAEGSGVPVLPVLMDGDTSHAMLVELAGDAWFDLRWSRNYLSEFTEMVGLIRHYMGEEAPQVVVQDI
jgi:hypothetical protein